MPRRVAKGGCKGREAVVFNAETFQRSHRLKAVGRYLPSYQGLHVHYYDDNDYERDEEDHAGLPRPPDYRDNDAKDKQGSNVAHRRDHYHRRIEAGVAVDRLEV